jgi:hypothetical protein
MLPKPVHVACLRLADSTDHEVLNLPNGGDVVVVPATADHSAFCKCRALRGQRGELITQKALNPATHSRRAARNCCTSAKEGMPFCPPARVALMAAAAEAILILSATSMSRPRQAA